LSRVPAIDRAAFEARFGQPIEREAHAFGRVNLIGEHTDYNDGFVLPTSIPQATTAAIARRPDRQARVHSITLDATAHFEIGHETPTHGWADYIQGVTQALQKRGFVPGGFDLAVDSTVPVGSGLSSSAALEVSVLRAIRDLFGLAIDDVMIAKIGRAAENDFVGAPVGIMDQMASSLSQPGVALFIDTRSLEYQTLRLPSATELVVINSGVAHNHAAGDYRTRRAECERAAALLEVTALRDVGLDRLDDVNALPEPLNRRARHIVTENARVLDAVAAMRAGDAISLGRLFSASHASQRDDFECSVPEVDRLVALAEKEPAVFGARLTGGGFGGSIVALVRVGEAAAVAERVAGAYGPGGTVLVP
jgi:galactokinase